MTRVACAPSDLAILPSARLCVRQTLYVTHLGAQSHNADFEERLVLPLRNKRPFRLAWPINAYSMTGGAKPAGRLYGAHAVRHARRPTTRRQMRTRQRRRLRNHPAFDIGYMHESRKASGSPDTLQVSRTPAVPPGVQLIRARRPTAGHNQRRHQSFALLLGPASGATTNSAPAIRMAAPAATDRAAIVKQPR